MEAYTIRQKSYQVLRVSSVHLEYGASSVHVMSIPVTSQTGIVLLVQDERMMVKPLKRVR